MMLILVMLMKLVFGMFVSVNVIIYGCIVLNQLIVLIVNNGSIVYMQSFSGNQVVYSYSFLLFGVLLMLCVLQLMVGMMMVIMIVIVINNCIISVIGVVFLVVGVLVLVLIVSGLISVCCMNGDVFWIVLNGGGSGNVVVCMMQCVGGGLVSYQFYQDSGFMQLWGDGIVGMLMVIGIGSGFVQVIIVYGCVFV